MHRRHRAPRRGCRPRFGRGWLRGRRARWGVCVESQTVSRSEAASYVASAARGSRAIGARRAYRISTATTLWARAKAASASPACHSCANAGESGPHCSVSKSIWTASTASRAVWMLSATTATTGWPTAPVRTSASTGQSASFKSGTSGLTAARPSPSVSAPVRTRCTPGMDCATATSRLVIRAGAETARANSRCRQSSGSRSETYRPAPRRRRSSSTRRRGAPKPSVEVAVSGERRTSRLASLPCHSDAACGSRLDGIFGLIDSHSR